MILMAWVGGGRVYGLLKALGKTQKVLLGHTPPQDFSPQEVVGLPVLEAIKYLNALNS